MENILISNPEKLQEKIKKMKDGGFDKLHILSDFDRSFTKCIVLGKKSSTSWAQFRNLDLFDEDYLKRSSEMFEHYRPIEISIDISKEEKQEKMKEWWEKHLELLVEKKLSREIINEVVERGGITLRDGAKNVFEFSKEKDVPLIFISSGLGDIVENVLKKEGVFYENISIVSNFFQFGEDGLAHSFDNELIINSQNKNEAYLEKLPIFDKIRLRKNIILVGDALEDIRMLGDAENDIIISIGFLNENVEENLEIFKESFDVVITGDGEMNYIIELLDKIKA